MNETTRNTFIRVAVCIAGLLLAKESGNGTGALWMCMPVLFLWSEEHHTITREAIRVQPKKVQDWLEPEKDLLWKEYCTFPDLNWPWYGEWGGEPGYPNADRLPDLRREWNMSYYVGWDPLLNEGTLFPPGRDTLPPGCPPTSTDPSFPVAGSRYCPMGSYNVPERYLPLVVKAIEEGRFADGMRFLGVLLHHVEDRGAFAYWPDLHMKGHVTDQGLVRIDGYKPASLGESTEEAAANLKRRMHELSDFQMKRAVNVAKAHKSGNVDDINAAVLEFAVETCRLTADTILTAAHLLDYGKPANYWGYWLEFPHSGNPFRLNLVDNPSFERDDGSGYPDGWVIGWHNLKDKLGRAEWDWSRKHSIFSKVVRGGERSVKLMWTPKEGIEWRQRWPVAALVNKGECYRCSAWIKTQEATGNTYLAAYTYRRDNEPVKTFRSHPLSGTRDWERVEFNVRIPERAERLRMACRSDGNSGAAWFDEVEMYRI